MDELNHNVEFKGYCESLHREASFMLNYLPQDIDTTSIGLSVLYKFGKVSMALVNSVLDKILLKYVCDVDGISQVYFDANRSILVRCASTPW